MRKKILLIPLALLLTLSLVATGCPAPAPPTAPEAEIAKLEADIAKLESGAKGSEAEIARLKKELTEAEKVVAPEVYELRLQSYTTRGSMNTEWVEEFIAERIEEMSNGQIKIELLAAGEVLSATDFLTGTGTGVVDLCFDCPGYHQGELPTEYIEFGLPGYINSAEDFYLFNYFFGWNEWVQPKVFTPLNIYRIAPIPLDSSALVTTRPVNRISDLKGMKIRGYGMSADILGWLGASMVPIAFEELYTSLMSGIIDGCTGPDWCMYHDMKLDEAVRYGVLPYIYVVQAARMIANMDVWEGLPKSLQEITTEASLAGGLLYYEAEVYHSALGLDEMLKEGFIITHLPEEDMPEWKAACAKLLDKVRALSPLAAEGSIILEDFGRTMGYIE